MARTALYRRVVLSVVLTATALAAPVVARSMTARSASAPPTISVLSNRADLISGGEALVAVSLPEGTDPAQVKVTLGTRDVTNQFAPLADGRFGGLVTGLAVGTNTLTVTLADGSSATQTLIDHALGGPLFSGPQVQPWVCQNGSKDPQCNAPATYAFQYKSSITGAFQSYDPSKPPSDVATTTTQNGVKVPFIVRLETGYMDRDQYQISVLYQPSKAWTAFDPQPQFVHKLLITHGASCGIDHQSGTAPSTTGDTVGVPGGPTATIRSPGFFCACATRSLTVLISASARPSMITAA